MIVKIKTSTNKAERRKLFADVQKLLKEEAPYVFVAQNFDLLAANRKIDVSTALLGADMALENVRPKR